MTDLADLDRTRRDYDRVAEQYDELIRRGDPSTDAVSAAMVDAFAELVRHAGSAGSVLDVGCGPGQWADYLDRSGIAVHGIDLSPRMIAIARRYRPDLRWEVGSVLRLDLVDRSLAGVLAHFSLIHLPPDLLPSALAEIARVLAPGAPALIGMQIVDPPVATDWVSYDHRASPAYLWTLDALADRLRVQGLSELARLRIVSPSPGKPPAGYLLALRDIDRPGG